MTDCQTETYLEIRNKLLGGFAPRPGANVNYMANRAGSNCLSASTTSHVKAICPLGNSINNLSAGLGVSCTFYFWSCPLVPESGTVINIYFSNK